VGLPTSQTNKLEMANKLDIVVVNKLQRKASLIDAASQMTVELRRRNTRSSKLTKGQKRKMKRCGDLRQ